MKIKAIIAGALLIAGVGTSQAVSIEVIDDTSIGLLFRVHLDSPGEALVAVSTGSIDVDFNGTSGNIRTTLAIGGIAGLDDIPIVYNPPIWQPGGRIILTGDIEPFGATGGATYVTIEYGNPTHPVVPTVPDGGATAALLGLGMSGLFAMRRH